jgi:hypothetical protein
VSSHYVCPCPNGCNGCEVPKFARRVIKQQKQALIEAEMRILNLTEGMLKLVKESNERP